VIGIYYQRFEKCNSDHIIHINVIAIYV